MSEGKGNGQLHEISREELLRYGQVMSGTLKSRTLVPRKRQETMLDSTDPQHARREGGEFPGRLHHLGGLHLHVQRHTILQVRPRQGVHTLLPVSELQRGGEDSALCTLLLGERETHRVKKKKNMKVLGTFHCRTERRGTFY